VRVWADGDWQGIENRNRKLLEKHFKAPKDKPSDGPKVRHVDASASAGLIATIPADLSIPPFLDRRVQPPALKEAA
jgi:hypothetical protein